MTLTSETKIFIGIIVISLVLVIGGVFAFSKPPAPEPVLPREQLIASDTNTKGNASASAYLVEFSDFQCPACQSAVPYVDAVVKKYQDNLQFAYRHFPLDQHPFAQKAAVAAEAAARQGKFWEAHDYLFANQADFSDEFLAGMGAVLGIDETKYASDRQDPALPEKVTADQNAALSLGVNSTPTFYLNGQKLNLKSFSDLDSVVGLALSQPAAAQE